MQSKIAYTDEVDDIEEAVGEIFDAFSDFEFKNNSLAIIFMEEDVEYPELYEGLSKKWDFPIIGCTCTAMLVSGPGFASDGISVLVMTADDCRFEAGVTGELTRDNYEKSIADLYGELSGRVGEKEKIIISYAVCVTARDHVSADDLLAATDAVSNGTPIIGGLASDRFSFDDTCVFCNEKLVKNGQVIVLVAGEFEPKYIHITSIEARVSPQTYEITESNHNEVMCIDGRPMVDVLKEEGFEVGKEDVLREYLLTPFIVTIPQPDGGEVRAARNLSLINKENKSGLFLGAMPKGSKIQVGFINRDNVKETLNTALNELKEYIGSTDYPYSTVLCTSCAARYLALANSIQGEAGRWLESLPNQLNFFGMYSNGEFCPVTDKNSGNDYNTFHNFTFVILAL